MIRIFEVITGETDKKSYMFYCPGCEQGHRFDDKTWTFNGDLENPTLSPSYLTGHNNYTERRCHSYVKNGKIQFLGDCFHELKGQTVDLPDLKKKWGK